LLELSLADEERNRAEVYAVLDGRAQQGVAALFVFAIALATVEADCEQRRPPLLRDLEHIGLRVDLLAAQNDLILGLWELA